MIRSLLYLLLRRLLGLFRSDERAAVDSGARDRVWGSKTPIGLATRAFGLATDTRLDHTGVRVAGGRRGATWLYET